MLSQFRAGKARVPEANAVVLATKANPGFIVSSVFMNHCMNNGINVD